MKILTTTILFQLPDDFKGDDLNSALEEFIKYRREKNVHGASMSIKNAKEAKTFSDKAYAEFMTLMGDKSDDSKSLHASGVYKLSSDGKTWEDNN